MSVAQPERFISRKRTWAPATFLRQSWGGNSPTAGTVRRPQDPSGSPPAESNGGAGHRLT